ncbi:GntR family transcriptional regulator [Hyphomonas sp.]|uniref:GntR family transcriptional regulator n=1 Tax=Hyphomonas sp. TaxID=87 RepID=UPI0035639F66
MSHNETRGTNGGPADLTGPETPEPSDPVVADGEANGVRAQGADRLGPAPEGAMLELLTAGLDRDAPIALNVQMRGVIEYGILMGSVPAGTRLPTVREFAESTGVATMTVVNVYNKLKAAGLIEARGKSGTFVSLVEGLPSLEGLQRLNQAIDELLTVARTLGLDVGQVAEMTGVRGNLQRARSTMPLRILFVGLFQASTAAYAHFIQGKLAEQDRIDTATIGTLSAAEPLLNYDLVLTLANRRLEVRSVVPAVVPVAGVNFVPSVETRTRLAGLDSAARVGIVSTFPEFTGLMRLNILRFISHVSSAEITLVDALDLADFVRRVDVVVYATGSDRVCDLVSSRQTAFEYRHSPDPNNIQNDILPLIEEIRSSKLLTNRAL